MDLTEDLKRERLQEILAGLFFKYHTEVEQITLDFLENAEDAVSNSQYDPIFDLDLTLNEIKGGARKLSKHKFETVRDKELLAEIIGVDYIEL